MNRLPLYRPMKTIRQSNRIVFDSGIPCTVCKKGSLIVAERNESLRCFHCGSGCADPLCWFCENVVSVNLLALGYVPSCLLGHQSGWVKFCGDFTAGTSFGTDWKKDIGERRKRAENLFSKIRLENCGFCEHRNADNVIKHMKDGKVIENKARIDEILASGGTIYLYEDPEATFCELDKDEFGPIGVCRRFSPSKKDSFYQTQKTKLPRYIHYLQLLELLHPSPHNDQKTAAKDKARELVKEGAFDK